MTTNQRQVATRPALEPDHSGGGFLAKLTPEQRQILKDRICLGAPDADCELFLQQVIPAGLNPWAMPPECWLIERRQQVNGQWVSRYIPQKSKDGALREAKLRGVYISHTIEHRVGDTWYPDGDEPLDAQHPDMARCRIPIPGTDRAVQFVRRWKEGAQYTKDGQLTDFWRRMPFEMLAKQALFGALKLLPLTSDIEIADEDLSGDDEGSSRGAFWAWADEQGITEPIVRRALQATDGRSLGEAVERMGGWNKARAYVAAKAESLLSLPTGFKADATAADLYRRDEEPARTPASSDAAFRERIGAVDESAPSASIDARGSDSESERASPGEDEQVDNSGDEQVTGCSYPGCTEAMTRFGPGDEPLCDAHADLAAGAEPAGDTYPPCPDDVNDLGSFLEAIPALGADRGELPKLGRLPPRNAVHQVWVDVWDRLAEIKRAEGARLV